MKTFIKNKMAACVLTLAALTSTFSSANAQTEETPNQSWLTNSLFSGIDCNWRDFYFTAEGLYWKACHDDNAYAIKQTVYIPRGEFKQNVKKPSLKWDFGYRLGVGYNLSDDCWNLYASWTHFNTSRRSHLNSVAPNSLGTVVIAQPIDTIATGFPSNIRNKYHLFMDWLDLEMGKRICFGDSFTFRPHIGLRALWLNQRNRSFILGQQIIPTSEPISGLSERVKRSEQYTALGLRAGFDTYWNLNRGFSLIGSIAGSILGGKDKNHIKDHFRLAVPGAIVQSFSTKLKDRNCSCKAVLDLAIAVRWEYLLCNAYFVNMQVGYEQHTFFNLARSTFAGRKFHSDLTLHGLTFGGTVRF